MNDYSLVILVGRLTRDPELRYTNPGGIPFVRMSVAVNRRRGGSDGDSKTEVAFVDVSAWRRMAELCAQFLKKGRTVMVVGRLRQSRWTGRDGGARSRLEVMADRVQFLGGRGGDGAPVGEESAAGALHEEAETPAE